MTRTRWLLPPAALLLALAGAGARAQPSPPGAPPQVPSAPPAGPAEPRPDTAGVRLEVVKYGQLAEAVRAGRGKVIVVDVWGLFCVPCKREFPNLVRLHHRYAGGGLVCMSVTVDRAERKDAALAFLSASGATFLNFLLDEPASVWQERWHLNGVPAVFVFDREGRRAARFDADAPGHPFTYADVEKLVRDLLGPGR